MRHRAAALALAGVLASGAHAHAVPVGAASTVVPVELPAGATIVVAGVLHDSRDGSSLDALSDSHGGAGLLDLDAGGLVAIQRDPATHTYRLARSGRPCAVAACPALVVNLLPAGTARLASVEELRQRLVGQLEITVETPLPLVARARAAAKSPALPVGLGALVLGTVACAGARPPGRRPAVRAARALERIERARPAHSALRESSLALAERTAALEAHARALCAAARRAASSERAAASREQARHFAERARAAATALEAAADGLTAPTAPPAEDPLVRGLGEELTRAHDAALEAEAILSHW